MAPLLLSLSAGGVLTIGDMPAVRRLALGLPIDLNRASAEDLSLVPGIGERMAIEIVQRRQTDGEVRDTFGSHNYSGDQRKES